MVRLFQYIVLVHLTLSCNNPEKYKPNNLTTEQDELPFEIVWRKDFSTPQLQRLSTLEDSLLILLTNEGLSSSFEYKLTTLRTSTGDTLWAQKNGLFVPTDLVVSNGIILCANKERIVATNLQTGQTIWEWTDSNSEIRLGLCTQGGKAYTSSYHKPTLLHGMKETRILEIDIISGMTHAIDTLYSQNRNNQTIYLHDPHIYQNAQSETLIAYGASEWRPEYFESSRPYLLVYNVGKKRVQFESNRHHFEAVSRDDIFVNDDQIIVSYTRQNFDRSIISFDRFNYEINWKSNLAAELNTGGMVFTEIDDLLYSTSGNKANMHALDPNTGILVWSNKKSGLYNSKPALVSDKIWITGTNGLIAFDPSSGELVHQIDEAVLRNYGPPLSLFGLMIPDPSSSRIYVMSQHALYCLQLKA